MNVLITGCSTGIGFESALKFARSGNRVYATMRDLAKAGPLQSAAAAERLDIRILQLDVDSQPSIDRAVREVLVEGPVDVLVNNAGVTGSARSRKPATPSSMPSWKPTSSALCA